LPQLSLKQLDQSRHIPINTTADQPQRVYRHDDRERKTRYGNRAVSVFSFARIEAAAGALLSVATEDAGDLAEDGDGLVERDEVPALASGSLVIGATGVFAQRDHFILQDRNTFFEGENTRDASDVHSRFHQLVDAAKSLQIGI
jgi:hypothetical protein